MNFCKIHKDTKLKTIKTVYGYSQIMCDKCVLELNKRLGVLA